MPGIYKLEDIKEYFLEIFTETTDYEFIVKRSAKLGSWRIIKSYIQNFKP